MITLFIFMNLTSSTSSIYSLQEKEAYEAFKMSTAKLPQCKSLKIAFQASGPHDHVESILHLLRKCVGITKFHIYSVSVLFTNIINHFSYLHFGQ